MKAEDVADTVLTAYKISDRTVMEEVLLRPQLGDI
jgi:NADP-dependent 3-hydroxy acid dehydrogenase YdfG